MTLFLVATPIGNLQDLSLRAVEVLRSCDYVLCEDTRHSRKLSNHFDLQLQLVSYHRFNEAVREEQVIADLRSGKIVGLISDAGTPALSDPGERLVARCALEEITVSAVPGPCSMVVALTLSGFPTQPFQFVGFLPRKKSALQAVVKEILDYPGTSVCFESPRRLKALLQEIAQKHPQRRLAIARELTKLHEEILRGDVMALLQKLETQTMRGEVVVVIAPPLESSESAMTPAEWIERVQQLESEGCKRSEAIKQIAQSEGVSRNELYRWVHGDAGLAEQ